MQVVKSAIDGSAPFEGGNLFAGPIWGIAVLACGVQAQIRLATKTEPVYGGVTRYARPLSPWESVGLDPGGVDSDQMYVMLARSELEAELLPRIGGGPLKKRFVDSTDRLVQPYGAQTPGVFEQSLLVGIEESNSVPYYVTLEARSGRAALLVSPRRRAPTQLQTGQIPAGAGPQSLPPVDTSDWERLTILVRNNDASNAAQVGLTNDDDDFTAAANIIAVPAGQTQAIPVTPDGDGVNNIAMNVPASSIIFALGNAAGTVDLRLWGSR